MEIIQALKILDIYKYLHPLPEAQNILSAHCCRQVSLK